jgi:hypothetical protein
MPRLKNIDRSSAVIATVAVVTAIAAALVPLPQKHGEKSHSHVSEKQDSHPESESVSDGKHGDSPGTSHSH